MASKTVPNIVTGSVPYDDAHEAVGVLLDALSLIYAVTDIAENDDRDGNRMDRYGLTDSKGLITNLLGQASDKVATAIMRLDV